MYLGGGDTVTEPGLQERVARLEGRTEDFGERFDGLDRRVDSLERRMDARFESLDQRLEAFERRVDARFEAMDRRFEAIETSMAKQFRWLVGGQVTLLVAVVGALSSALFVG